MSQDDPKTAFASAARRLMLELAQGGLRMGLSYGTLEATLRDATLEAAFQQSQRAGTKITTSSLHVATGIHRREVSRWLNERGTAEPDEQLQGTNSPSARIVARWSTNRSYIHEDGTPILLPMNRRNDGPSFVQLVEEIGPEVRAKSVLEGLIAAGLVEDLEDGNFRLATAAYLPEANSKESIDFLAANVGDHLASAVHNISAPAKVRLFERAMFSNEVSERTARLMQDRASEEGMTFLRSMVAQANGASEKDEEESLPLNRRIRVGVYFYEGDQEA